MAIAEFERSIIQERVVAGLKAAKARGVKLGQPSKLTQQYSGRVSGILAQGMGVRAIARSLNLPVGSAFKLVDAVKRGGAF